MVLKSNNLMSLWQWKVSTNFFIASILSFVPVSKRFWQGLLFQQIRALQTKSWKYSAWKIVSIIFLFQSKRILYLSATKRVIINMTKRRQERYEISSLQTIFTIATNRKRNRKTRSMFQWQNPWFVTPFILRRDLRQITAQDDAKHTVTWCKLQHL